jgi:hypothetical protein
MSQANVELVRRGYEAWARRVTFERIGRHSGTPVSIDVGHVWTFRDGQVTHILALPWAEALEAVDLSPE